MIYAQTDSLFCHLPKASCGEAISMAQEAARLVSDAFPKNLDIKYEKVCQPFMLLHVNRCASSRREVLRNHLACMMR